MRLVSPGPRSALNYQSDYGIFDNLSVKTRQSFHVDRNVTLRLGEGRLRGGLQCFS